MAQEVAGSSPVYHPILQRGVEQWQLVRLITWRSMVRFHSPLPLKDYAGHVTGFFVCYLFVLFLRLSFSENGPSLFLNHPIQFLNQLKITKNHYQIHIDACIFHKVQYFSSIVVRWNMFLYGWAEVIIWKIGRKRGIPWCLPRDHLQMDRRQRHARPPYRPLLEVQERWGRCLGQIR